MSLTSRVPLRCADGYSKRMTDTALPSSEAVEQMCDLMSGMVSGLVDQPDLVEVESEPFEAETVIRVFVAPDDLGKLVGKQARTARSLRTILSAAGSKLNHRFSLDIQPNEP